MDNVLKSQNELAHCVAIKMFIDAPTDSGDWDFIVGEKSNSFWWFEKFALLWFGLQFELFQSVAREYNWKLIKRQSSLKCSN